METASSASERSLERDDPALLPAVVPTPRQEGALVPTRPASPPTRWRRLASQMLPVAGAALTYAAQRLAPILVDAVLDAVERRFDQSGRAIAPDRVSVGQPDRVALGAPRGRRHRWHGRRES